MKHCKSCRYCVLDKKALWYMGLIICKCEVKDEIILRPFFKGFRCKAWRKDK